jgi:DNA-binding transcriptional regulator YiaG
VDEVMQKLTVFVEKFEKFIKSIEDSDRIDEKYVKDFEEIFSVTEETLLLREIQDIRDELNMLAAVFKDQLGVLHRAGETIAEDRERLPETRSSAFNFQQQSEKHARHVERMRVQASQAYDTVSSPSP